MCRPIELKGDENENSEDERQQEGRNKSSEGIKVRETAQGSPFRQQEGDRAGTATARRRDSRRNREGNRLAEHSIRGFLSAQVGKKMRLKVESTKHKPENVLIASRHNAILTFT
jgi:hypothetical protein